VYLAQSTLNYPSTFGSMPGWSLLCSCFRGISKSSIFCDRRCLAFYLAFTNPNSWNILRLIHEGDPCQTVGYTRSEVNGQNLNGRTGTKWLSSNFSPCRFVCILASSWHWHIKRLSTPCGGQPESQFGADYLRKNHLSQKFAELRYIEIISKYARVQIPSFTAVRSSTILR